MCMCELRWLHCTRQWVWYGLLNEHVYCVAFTFKMIEWVEQWICNRFCIKLEYSSAEIICMLQKACSYGQLATGSFIMTTRPLTHHVLCRVFSETSNHPDDSAPHTAQIWCPMTSGFSQNWNHHWKRRDIRPLMRFRKIQRDSWWRWENCVRSPGAYFEGDWGIIVLCTVCFVASIFFNKCLYFSYYMAEYLLDRPPISLAILMYFYASASILVQIRWRRTERQTTNDLESRVKLPDAPTVSHVHT